MAAIGRTANPAALIAHIGCHPLLFMVNCLSVHILESAIVATQILRDSKEKTSPSTSVAFAAVYGVFFGAGLCLAAAATADCVYNSWKAKSLRPPQASAVYKLFTGKLSAACIVLITACTLIDASKRSRFVDRCKSPEDSQLHR
jgi:hypothetical protein